MDAETYLRDLAAKVHYQRQSDELLGLPAGARAAYVASLMRRWIVSVRARVSDRAMTLLTAGLKIAEAAAQSDAQAGGDGQEEARRARVALRDLEKEMEENVFLTHAVQTVYFGLEALTNPASLTYLISNYFADVGAYAPAYRPMASGERAISQTVEEELMNWPPAQREAKFQLCVLTALRTMSLDGGNWLRAVDGCWIEPTFVW